MYRYKIEANDLQFPVFIETESNTEAFDVFVAICDYNGIDEDNIECQYDDEGNMTSAMAWMEDSEEEEPEFKLTRLN